MAHEFQTVDQITWEIVTREGPYVNDPDDPGGATKWGLTIGTMKSLGMDLDGDGDVDIYDVKNVTREIAADVFKSHYFFKPRIHKLPLPLQAPVYDMQVNSGNNAVKILQKSLNRVAPALGIYPLVTDGSIGEKTIDLASIAHTFLGDAIVDVYSVDRREWYYRVGDGRDKSRKYIVRDDGGKAGWITRAEDFMSPQFHLTQKQHKQRTRRWS